MKKRKKMLYPDLIAELKRVHRLYGKKDLAHFEAVQVLKNLCDLYGLNLVGSKKITLKNHV